MDRKWMLVAVAALILCAVLALRFGPQLYYAAGLEKVSIQLPHNNETVELAVTEKQTGYVSRIKAQKNDSGQDIFYSREAGGSSGSWSEFVEIDYSDKAISYQYKTSDGRSGGATYWDCTRGSCGFEKVKEKWHFNDEGGTERVICFANGTFTDTNSSASDNNGENSITAGGNGCPTLAF